MTLLSFDSCFDDTNITSASANNCVNHNCTNPRAFTGRSETGRETYRPMCSKCYRAGCGLTEFDEGVIPVKKKFCENRDGRLGIACRATRLEPYQLDLDHIDGNNQNNTPENIQTLCKNCHAYKSKKENDYKRKYQ